MHGEEKPLSSGERPLFLCFSASEDLVKRRLEESKVSNEF
jgi:hypothetical protein